MMHKKLSHILSLIVIIILLLSSIMLTQIGIEKTIMFVHGYAGCAETWEFQINHFARSYRVVAPDLRGHGQSAVTPGDYRLEQLADDLLDLADAQGLDRFDLCGVSIGGSSFGVPPLVVEPMSAVGENCPFVRP